MTEPEIGTRVYDHHVLNTWVAWRRMWLDMMEHMDEDGIPIYYAIKRMVKMVIRRIKCVIMGHGETHTWVSLKDPGWVAVYCKRCGVLLYMEKRR